MSTPFHAKYFAHEISLHHAAGSVQQLSTSLFDACVDLNPHQIEAALFAVQSPLSQGAILADEVGLGKTIEAGLLLTQYWAERKRKLLIIAPASLRKQWSNELRDKFHLPNMVLDSRIYKSSIEKGEGNPFDQDIVFIVSIHFAGQHSARLRTIDWDLVVIDEAHKLRNVYRKKNKFARNIKWAVDGKKKILLTATPLQNSLMELYGLSSIIDEHYFGDADSFRNQFINKTGNEIELRSRLAKFIRRTLRNDVTEYIRYTERRSMTLPYENLPEEQHLYDRMSEFINREDTYSIPKAQRHLMTLVLNKILASSRYAITETLKTMRARLFALKEGQKVDSLFDHFMADDAMEDEYFEDYADELEELGDRHVDPELLEEEIAALSSLIDLAEKLPIDTKAETLFKALDIGFKELKKMGANRKAIIFTESRRTQDYLAKRLQDKGYAGKVVLFNGSNDDPLSKEIYNDWVTKNKDTGNLAGSKAIDMRSAIVEFFRDDADIMIATEAASEGVNLQFCSLLINYDLPWNPQRIEQRIGRCHRYGQQHDVVVINFLNQLNATDCRVYELLDQKFHLFDGIFGASDGVLGALDSDLDFERRIQKIYNECRHPEQIELAFEELQREMDEIIQDRMNDTKRILLEHFDSDVHKRLNVNLDETREILDHIGERFWELSQYVLSDVAEFDDTNLHFHLLRSPLAEINCGRYHMVSKKHANITGEFLYRLSHPLGEYVINAGKNCQSRVSQVYFDVSNHPRKITPLQRLKGQSGWMALKKLTIDSFEKEEYLIFTGLTDNGKVLDQELCEQFFLLRGAVAKPLVIDDKTQKQLDAAIKKETDKRVKTSIDVNNSYFIEECDKLDQWAEDAVISIERELDAVKKEIRGLSRQGRLIKDPVEQHKLQVEQQKLERQKKELRERLFMVEDDVIHKRDKLIHKVEQRMQHEHFVEEVFVLRWTVI